MCRISSATFVSRRNRDHDRENSKSGRKGRDKRTFHSCHGFITSTLRITFAETGCHAKTRLPDQRLWQPARPCLLTIKRIHTQKVCYLSYLALYLKKQNKHTNTLAPRFSRIIPGRKKPTLGRASRDVSDTRAWHATCIL